MLDAVTALGRDAERQWQNARWRPACEAAGVHESITGGGSSELGPVTVDHRQQRMTRTSRTIRHDSGGAFRKPSLIFVRLRVPSCVGVVIAVRCVGHDVDRELGVVVTLEALVAPVVVPLAAVVLVASRARRGGRGARRRGGSRARGRRPSRSARARSGADRRGTGRTRDRAGGCSGAWRGSLAGEDAPHLGLERVGVESRRRRDCSRRRRAGRPARRRRRRSRSFSLKRTSLWPVMNRNGNPPTAPRSRR